MKKSVFDRSFAILLISCIFCSILSGCGSSSKSSSSEPPVYSPLRVLVPETPGSDTLGSSPLTQNASEYFAESVKDYMLNPGSLKAQRPNTYKAIEKALSMVTEQQIELYKGFY